MFDRVNSSSHRFGMMIMVRACTAVLVMHACVCATEAQQAPVPGPVMERLSDESEDGWTEIVPADDAWLIHVSSSEGDDRQDGMSAVTPVKTLARAKSLLRNGSADRMLLKRGDVWTEAIGPLARENGTILSGRSAAEPMVIGTYGDERAARPMLRIGAEIGIAPWSSADETTSYVAIVGLHFYAHTRDPDSADYEGHAGGDGMKSLSYGESILVEDCLFEFCCVVFDPFRNGTDGVRFRDFRFRRNVVYGNYSSGGHAQGIFVDSVDGILLEGNVFDHNGWNTQAGAKRTVYNHNAYITSYCTDLVARGNIFARGGSSGLQARPGGVVTNNLFVKNACQLNYGHLEGLSKPTPGGVYGRVSGNVILDGDAIDPKGGAEAAMWGMMIGNVGGPALIGNNLVVRTGGITFNGKTEGERVGIQNLRMWRTTIIEPEHPALQLVFDAFDRVTVARCTLAGDPPIEDRDHAESKILFSMNSTTTDVEVKSIGAYHAEYAGGEPTFEAFLEEARKQRRGNWRWAYHGGVAARRILDSVVDSE